MLFFWIVYSLVVISLFYMYPIQNALGYVGYFIFIFVAIKNRQKEIELYGLR